MGKAKEARREADRNKRRRCLFCGGAVGEIADPDDPRRRKIKTMTEEHLFRESWQGKLITSNLPRDHPLFIREFTTFDIDGSVQKSRPEFLFEVKVRWVCDICNSSWMNRLDDDVEPWIFNPYEDALKPDPLQFRLWAIKVAVLRCYYQNKIIPDPKDIRAIYDREDIRDWHIFVGQMGFPNHTHTLVGFGPISMEGGRLEGITQVSWSLGRVMVTAMRVVGPRAAKYLTRFRQDNISEGVVVAEVQPHAPRFPSIALLPKLNMRGYMSLAWYFSSHPLSPVAPEVWAIEHTLRQYAADKGFLRIV